jgi:hypothetical protein
MFQETSTRLCWCLILFILLHHRLIFDLYFKDWIYTGSSKIGFFDRGSGIYAMEAVIAGRGFSF